MTHPPHGPRHQAVQQLLEGARAQPVAAIARDLHGIMTGVGAVPSPHRPTPHHLTPDTVRYQRVSTTGHRPDGLTLILSPHPSDGTDFTGGLMAHLQNLGAEYRELCLTRGELGEDAVTEEAKRQTIAVRLTEEAESARTLGYTLHYLPRLPGEHSFFNDAYYFPDGALLDHLPELTAHLKEYITTAQPKRLLIPSLHHDHPDHVATAIAALNALMQLRAEGYMHAHGAIEVIASDPEFAVADPHTPVARRIGAALEGVRTQPWFRAAADAGTPFWLPDPHYPYRGITAQPEAEAAAGHPFAVPTDLILLPEALAHRKMLALTAHATQMGEDKPYRALITKLLAARGSQTGVPGAWAEGYHTLAIPGITPHPDTAQPTLFSALPDETVFRLHQTHTAQRTGVLATMAGG